jgi:uncharacterized protein
MLWILSLAKSLSVKNIAYIAAFLAIFSAGAYVNGIRWEHKLESALKDQQEALVKACEADKKKTAEVSRAYQDKIAALNSRVAALRMRPAKCVPVASPTGGRNGETSGTEPVRAHGVDAGFLIDYAAEAEKYRLQLISCQEFIRLERK